MAENNAVARLGHYSSSLQAVGNGNGVAYMNPFAAAQKNSVRLSLPPQFAPHNDGWACLGNNALPHCPT